MQAVERTITHAQGFDREALARRLVEDTTTVAEQIARELNLPPVEIMRLLPEDLCRWAPGTAFAEVMGDVAEWGEVLFLVHTVNAIVEVKAEVPKGKSSADFYNLHGPGALGGHLKASRCAAIAFVSRPFMKMETRSIQFFDGDGEGMFKIYVGRDAERRLKPEQITRFEALAARLCPVAAE